MLARDRAPALQQPPALPGQAGGLRLAGTRPGQPDSALALGGVRVRSTPTAANEFAGPEALVPNGLDGSELAVHIGRVGKGLGAFGPDPPPDWHDSEGGRFRSNEVARHQVRLSEPGPCALADTKRLAATGAVRGPSAHLTPKAMPVRGEGVEDVCFLTGRWPGRLRCLAAYGRRDRGIPGRG